MRLLQYFYCARNVSGQTVTDCNVGDDSEHFVRLPGRLIHRARFFEVGQRAPGLSNPRINGPDPVERRRNPFRMADFEAQAAPGLQEFERLLRLRHDLIRIAETCQASCPPALVTQARKYVERLSQI